MKNFFLIFLFVSCAHHTQLKEVGSMGARKTFKGKNVELSAVLINRGIKICPSEGKSMHIRDAYYSLYRSKRNDTLRFEKSGECFEAKMNLERNKVYRINLLVDNDDVQEKEIHFQLSWGR